MVELMGLFIMRRCSKRDSIQNFNFFFLWVSSVYVYWLQHQAYEVLLGALLPLFLRSFPTPMNRGRILRCICWEFFRYVGILKGYFDCREASIPLIRILSLLIVQLFKHCIFSLLSFCFYDFPHLVKPVAALEQFLMLSTSGRYVETLKKNGKYHRSCYLSIE